jgi:hypothetical protein
MTIDTRFCAHLELGPCVNLQIFIRARKVRNRSYREKSCIYFMHNVIFPLNLACFEIINKGVIELELLRYVNVS